MIHDELAIDHDAILQCAEEVLHHCVIQTVSFVRHILCYSMGFNFAYSLPFDIANPDPYVATGHPPGRALTMHRAPSY
ncbi:hypothetical protein SGP16018_34680 [Shigella flexneri]|nr:hypothetical protein SGP16018_34680 [Shigella flexneri]